MIDPDRLLIFVDVVESGGITAAAQKRALSKAAISKQITILEEECGAQLLNRSTRTVQLTSVGQEVFQEAQRLYGSMKEVEAILKGHKRTPQGNLRVFAGRHYGESYIVPRIGEWLKRYPAVTLDLELGERIPNLDKEELDIVIGLSISGSPTSIQKRIGTTRYVLCASPGYLKAFGKPKKIADLSQHRYLSHSMRQPNYSVMVGNREVVLKPFIYVNDVQALKQLALQDLGIAWLHEYAVHSELIDGRLISLLTEFTAKADISLYVYYKETKFVTSKVRAFIDFFSQPLRSAK